MEREPEGLWGRGAGKVRSYLRHAPAAAGSATVTGVGSRAIREPTGPSGRLVRPSIEGYGPDPESDLDTPGRPRATAYLRVVEEADTDLQRDTGRS